ncbi:MAG: FeoA domain-containing protein [Candidatus Altiarchaeales archaeon]|nr:FeoA domain-containing protein [Candidatus Altiarchaeales archaeon]
MTPESNILRIVEEDILRMLGEGRGKISGDFMKSDIKASDLFISRAVKELEREALIITRKNFILLTKKGEVKASDIVKKHLILEDYFKKTRGEREAHEIAHTLEHYVSKEVIDSIKKLSTLKKEGVPLTRIRLSEEGIITDLMFSDMGLLERVVSVGIFIGEKIKVANRISSIIIVNIGNKKMALDREIAKEIKVLKDERA